MPISDIFKAGAAKIRTIRVNSNLARYWTNKIGPEGIVGAKNYDIHYNTIKSFIDKNQQDKASSYVRQQQLKLDRQKRGLE